MGSPEGVPEDIVVHEVVRYFATPRFERFFIEEEYPIQIGSYKGRADVVLINKDRTLAAIIECKRGGYEGNGTDQLKSYLSATNTPLGIFANETDPAAWKFYQKRGQNQFNQIDRSRFEKRLLKSGLVKKLDYFVLSLFRRRRAPSPPTAPPPPEPIAPPTATPDDSRAIYIGGNHTTYLGGDQIVQNNNSNTDFDPSLTDKPYYSEASGFYWAANHHGMAECVPQHVKQIISNEELEIKSTQEQLQGEINKLVDEKDQLKKQKGEYERDLEQRAQELARSKEQVAGLEVQLQAPTETELNLAADGGATGGTKSAKQGRGSLILQSIFPIFTTLALVGLLFYLFIFYASAGDKAFSSSTGTVEQQLNEIVYHAALSEAWKERNGFVLLFPFIFLVLAITTHLSWEYRDREYMVRLLASTLLVTLMLDSIIAVKISQRIHDDKVVRGILEDSEKWTALDLNILAVLLLGFAISLLLSYGLYWTFQLWRGVWSLRIQSQKQEIRAIQIENEKVQREMQITILKTKMEILQSEVDRGNENIETNQKKVDQIHAKIEELSELRNKRFVNGHQIESRVSQFLKGWCRFVVHSGDKETDVSAQISKIETAASDTINQYRANSPEYSYQS